MAGGTKKGKSPAAGKKSSPGSQARVERKKKVAGKTGRAASQPRVGKGTEGTGGKGGGLH
ncbi:MAG TPA: hypothetical protein VIP46_18240 [Pyrinomonadaceae bacterium]